jgi:hypothetical protein
MHFINSLFGIPDGSVWGNLIATVLTAVPAYVIGMWRFEVRHKRHQAALHNQISQEFASLTDKSNT